MSASTVPSSSSNSSHGMQTGTEAMDNSDYIYLIPDRELSIVCYHLDQDNVWEELARQMGYNTTDDIIRIKKMAKDKGCLPAEQLLSLWGDQNHSVLELYKLLYNLNQFSAMDCLKRHVPTQYHRLVNKRLPNFKELLRQNSGAVSQTNSNIASRKILNGPEMSRDTNESDLSYMNSSQSSSAATFNENDLKEMAKAIPHIKYHELVWATKEWNPNNILGRGGFGEVFKGSWKNTDVAIKKIVYRGAVRDSKQKALIQLKQSLNELKHLNSCRHDNILPLYGFSLDQEIPNAEPCLVYQYMPGGSLESRLYPKRSSKTGEPLPFTPLSFRQRNQIALGTARGLQYLHTYMSGRPLIHGDIKPANILLDTCSSPKIGDFGLVREGSVESMEVSSVYGTKPYLPTEFLYNRTLSTKIDTYSFGVVLFELYTAMKAYDLNRGKDMAFLAKCMRTKYKNNEPMCTLLDQGLVDNKYPVSMELYQNLMKIALVCTEEIADKRPEMVNVYNKLDECIDPNQLPGAPTP